MTIFLDHIKYFDNYININIKLCLNFKIMSGVVKVERYYIPPDENEIENAFEQVRLFLKDNNASNIVLLTNTQDIGEDLEIFIDRKLRSPINSLLRNPVHLSDITIRMESNRTFNRAMANNSAIIGFYPGKNMLDLLNDSKNALAIIIVPSIVDPYVEDWIDIWNPEVFGGQKGILNPLIESCILKKGLETLTRLYGHSNHELSNPDDKANATELLYRLNRSGEFLDPSLIRKWSIRNGWSSEGSYKLEDIAKSLNEGRRIRRNQNSWRSNLIEQFTEECENE